MATDKELLEKLRKALEEKGHTTALREPWQEHLDRHTSVSSTASLQASEIFSDFAGSWAASYQVDPTATDLDKISNERLPPSPAKMTSKLGLPGYPEVNFIPYSHNTNRFGVKGPSLLGHPISFEVIGPTAKSPNVDWQWFLQEGSSEDRLYLDLGANLQDPNGSSVLAPSITSLQDGYGDLYGDNSQAGIYVIITQTGENSKTDTQVTGVGDGYIALEGVAGPGGGLREAIRAKTGASKYEIFRVVSWSNDYLQLDPGKRIRDHFDISASTDPIIRSIMLVRPKATRMVSIPGTGDAKGQERALVVVPPERSLNSDLKPPYEYDNAAPGSWRTEGFYGAWPGLGNGDSNLYAQGSSLPVPRIVGRSRALLPSTLEVPGVPPNLLVLKAATYSGVEDARDELKAGDVIHLHEVYSDELAEVAPKLTASPHGWWEVTSVPARGGTDQFIQLRGIEEVNPRTGKAHFGPWAIDGSGQDLSQPVPQVWVKFTIHKPIKDLWSNTGTGYQFDLDALKSARLTNLIDPSWVRESGKAIEIGHETVWAKADKAIFDTTSSQQGLSGTNANPGSLLDLGFRMVLFPAMASGDHLVPDFANPIDSLEVRLDEDAADERQYLTIDYSAGIVVLSHSPKLGCELDPHGLIGQITDLNPRGELVLFASCVPYSMEMGQLGSSIRVTSGAMEPDWCLPDSTQADVYGARHRVDIKTDVDGAPQIVGSQVLGQSLVLALAVPATPMEFKKSLAAFPVAGHIEILQSSEAPAFTTTSSTTDTIRLSTFSYNGVDVYTDSDGPWVRLRNVYGGADAGNSVTVNHDGEFLVVFRKDFYPETVIDSTGDSDFSYQLDTTHGSAKRTKTLRFAHANLFENLDGTITVYPTAVDGPAEELRAFFPLGGPDDTARFHLVPETQMWTADSGPCRDDGEHEVGIEIKRGRFFSSMRVDVRQDHMRYWRFTNLVSKLELQAPQGLETPPDTFVAHINTGQDATQPLPPHYMDWMPQSEGALCAVIEGSVIFSRGLAELGSSAVSASTESARFVLNARMYMGLDSQFFAGRPSFRDEYAQRDTFPSRGLESQIAGILAEAEEGPANPINWFAHTAEVWNNDLNADRWEVRAKELREDVNNHYGRQRHGGMGKIASFYTDALESPNYKEDTRLAFTERQVSTLPTKPYLLSDPIPQDGMAFPEGYRYILTVKSADPKNGNASKWITAQVISTDEMPVTTDPNVVAHYLNNAIYDGTVSNNIDAELDNAGFFKTLGAGASYAAGNSLLGTSTLVSNLTRNPMLTRDERQFLWCGPGDPRHPEHVIGGSNDTGKVALLCGGWGSASAESSAGSHRDFTNVVVEFTHTADFGDAGCSGCEDLAEFLGGDFALDRPTCGLFFGGHAWETFQVGAQAYGTDLPIEGSQLFVGSQVYTLTADDNVVHPDKPFVGTNVRIASGGFDTLKNLVRAISTHSGDRVWMFLPPEYLQDQTSQAIIENAPGHIIRQEEDVTQLRWVGGRQNDPANPWLTFSQPGGASDLHATVWWYRPAPAVNTDVNPWEFGSGLDGNKTEARLSDALGFLQRGTPPLGSMAGSFPIRGTYGDTEALVLGMPKGDSPYYSGPQAGTGLPKIHGKHAIPGYLGRWAWDIENTIDPIDVTDPTTAGIGQILATYGVGAHSENHFSSQLANRTSLEMAGVAPDGFINTTPHPHHLQVGDEVTISGSSLQLPWLGEHKALNGRHRVIALSTDQDGNTDPFKFQIDLGDGTGSVIQDPIDNFYEFHGLGEVSVGKTFQTTDTRCGFGEQQTGYESFLVYAVELDRHDTAALLKKKTVRDFIGVGDIITGRSLSIAGDETYPFVPVEGQRNDPSFHGLVFDPLAPLSLKTGAVDEQGAPVTVDKIGSSAFTFLVHRTMNTDRAAWPSSEQAQLASALPSHLRMSEVQPYDFGFSTPDRAFPVGESFSISIIANANAITSSGTFKSLYSALYGIHGKGYTGTSATPGLDGGSVTSWPGESSIPNAIFMAGGRINLLSNLNPTAPAGLVFSSPTPGVSDVNAEERYATTYIEHGVFVSTFNAHHPSPHSSYKLPTIGVGAPLDSAGLHSAFSTLRGNTEAQFKGGSSIGGVGGLRISGDATIWLKNVRGMGGKNAYVRRSPTIYYTKSPSGAPALGNTTTGPITSFGRDGVSGHTPSGFSASKRTTVNSDGATLHLQEATIEIGLTRADLASFRYATGNPEFPALRDDVHEPLQDQDSDGYWDDQGEGERMLHYANAVDSVDLPVPARFLTGSYLTLSPTQPPGWDEAGSPNTRSSSKVLTDLRLDEQGNPTLTNPNDGSWRITGVPMITASFRTSGSIDGYGASVYQTFPAGDGMSSGPVVDTTSPDEIVQGTGFQGMSASASESSIVAVLQVRVERYSLISSNPALDEGSLFHHQFVPENANPGEFRDGEGIALDSVLSHTWSISADPGGDSPILVAEVIDPGGSPTGAPASLHGLTFNPKVLASGANTVPMRLVPVFSRTPQTDSIAGMDTRLMGIHSNQTHRGETRSFAMFTVKGVGRSPVIWDTAQETYLRATIFSSQRADRLDDLISSQTTQGVFERDQTGRVSFVGHPARLGLGVVLDGGLGLVSARAFRAQPRSPVTDTVGSLTVFGHNAAYPMLNLLKPRQHVGVELPSTFNTVEFYEDTVIVGPLGSLIFDDGRAVHGLPAMDIAGRYASASFKSSPHRLGIGVTKGYAAAGAPGDNWSIGDLITRSDTLFPFTVAGIKFHSPGGLVYERAYRSIDARTGPKSMFLGKKAQAGIRGLEIPWTGECLLLPKGPPTIHGKGHANWRWTNDSSGWDYFDFGEANRATGHTPLDTPLYEFHGGYGRGHLEPHFPVLPGPIFDTMTTSGVQTNLISPDSSAGVSQHRGHPGNVYMGYRHSLSRDDGDIFKTWNHWNSSAESFTKVARQQMRVLDGMVLEDVTNGTFFTIGDIGRMDEMVKGTIELVTDFGSANVDSWDSKTIIIVVQDWDDYVEEEDGDDGSGDDLITFVIYFVDVISDPETQVQISDATDPAEKAKETVDNLLQFMASNDWFRANNVGCVLDQTGWDEKTVLRFSGPVSARHEATFITGSSVSPVSGQAPFSLVPNSFSNYRWHRGTGKPGETLELGQWGGERTVKRSSTGGSVTAGGGQPGTTVFHFLQNGPEQDISGGSNIIAPGEKITFGVSPGPPDYQQNSTRIGAYSYASQLEIDVSDSTLTGVTIAFSTTDPSVDPTLWASGAGHWQSNEFNPGTSGAKVLVEIIGDGDSSGAAATPQPLWYYGVTSSGDILAGGSVTVTGGTSANEVALSVHPGSGYPFLDVDGAGIVNVGIVTTYSIPSSYTTDYNLLYESVAKTGFLNVMALTAVADTPGPFQFQIVNGDNKATFINLVQAWNNAPWHEVFDFANCPGLNYAPIARLIGQIERYSETSSQTYSGQIPAYPWIWAVEFMTREIGPDTSNGAFFMKKSSGVDGNGDPIWDYLMTLGEGSSTEVFINGGMGLDISKIEAAAEVYGGTDPNGDVIPVRPWDAGPFWEGWEIDGLIIELIPFVNGYTPELIFDLNGHYDPTKDLFSTQEAGYGDRVDGGMVRRNLAGHLYRVVPNVEFVPVLGKRGVDGGLLPPLANPHDPQSVIPSADAVFYSAGYNFRGASSHGVGDIGRSLYICGTHNYVYTGWWTIIDVVENYPLSVFDDFTLGRPENGDHSLRTVAVLRKSNRGNGTRNPADNGLNQGDGALPLQYRPPRVRMGMNHQTNGFPQGDKRGATHYGFFSQGSVTGKRPEYSDLWLTVTLSKGGPTEALHRQQWRVLTDDMWDGIVYDIDSDGVIFPLAANPSLQVTDAVSLATYCNQDVRTNGKAVKFPAGHTLSKPWIRWQTDHNVSSVYGTAVVVSYNTNELKTSPHASEWLCGPGGRLQINFFSNASVGFQGGDPSAGAQYTMGVGFLSFTGHNSELDATTGDRNNHLWAHPVKLYGSQPSDGILEVDAGMHVNSAAGGLRWVFSAPLVEENIGSYLHLTKPSVYRFSKKLASQKNADVSYEEDFHWTSGYPREGDTYWNSTDIFRVNRCPNTMNMMVGGDCETYSPEIIRVYPSAETEIVDEGATDSGQGRMIMYSPLGVWGNWPDSATGSLPASGSVNEPVIYALQPIARERIVSIKASAGSSNVVRGAGYDPIQGSMNDSGLTNDRLGRGPLSGVHVQEHMVGDVSSSHVSPTGIIMSSPWLLLSRADAQRAVPQADGPYSIAEAAEDLGQAGNNIGSNFFGDTANWLLNSHDPIWVDPEHGEWTGDPQISNEAQDSYFGLGQVPSYFYSLYAWAPAGQWWETLIPNLSETQGQYNASCTPPTMRFDLTEAYTQAMQPGGGTNSPYPNHAPKGARLNRIWVNFGVWGNEPQGRHTQLGLPGYKQSDNTTAPNEVLSEYHMAFNLVCELPGSQARLKPRDHTYVQLKWDTSAQGAYYTDTYWYGTTITIRHSDTMGNIQSLVFEAVEQADLTALDGGGDPLYETSDHNLGSIGPSQTLGKYVVPLDAPGVVPSVNHVIAARRLAAEINRVSTIASDPNHNDYDPNLSSFNLTAYAVGTRVRIEANVPGDSGFEIRSHHSYYYIVGMTTSLYQPPRMVLEAGSVVDNTPTAFRTFRGGAPTELHTGTCSFPFGDRAPNALATYNASQLHHTDQGSRAPGGTVVIPLYCNREAGDLMPNVMERYVDVGPYSEIGYGQLTPDWALGSYEFGFGAGESEWPWKRTTMPIEKAVLQGEMLTVIKMLPWYLGGHMWNLSLNDASFSMYMGNAHTPVVWGGIDFDTANSNPGGFQGEQTERGQFTAPFLKPEYSIALASLFPRLSRVGGGVRDTFTSGLVANGDIFRRSANGTTGNGPASLSAAAMTGIVVAHNATSPRPPLRTDGGLMFGAETSPSYPNDQDESYGYTSSGQSGTSKFSARSPGTCPHAFTIALTPVGDRFDPPRGEDGHRVSVSPHGIHAAKDPVSGHLVPRPYSWDGDQRLPFHGRTLQPYTDRPFKVGNWLDEVLKEYGIATPSGSMLPPGARIFLEVATGPGPGVVNAIDKQYWMEGQDEWARVSSGCWVGSVKCAFDVETADGTAYTRDVNVLGDEEDR